MMEVGVDVGGTFTDLVALEPDGRFTIRKVASTPSDPAEGVFHALSALGRSDVAVLKHGTTVATNALLERRGARVALVTTAGFEDLLWLRRQDRAALYDLARDHPPPLVAREDVIGARERIGPDGVLVALTAEEVRRVVAAVRQLAPEAVAVSLLFAFRDPRHEERICEALRAALPDVPVAASHEVLPVFREYERTSTTTAEAYLRPKVASYVTKTGRAAAAQGITAFRILTSSGGTLTAEQAATHAASLALSGPVGGVLAAAHLHLSLGSHKSPPPDLLTLDMGGTSADASFVARSSSLFGRGGAIREGAGSVAGVPLALPAILIETVSAGGGSVAWVDDGGALKVGPRSAGAQPGPACYGRGGMEPTVTDACLVLGWLDPANPLADSLRLDRAAAERAIDTLPVPQDRLARAAGIVEVATAVMARALKRVSVARGIDPRTLALLPFGGAGPLFGCALADSLGMSQVIIPPHPGVLSALGLAIAPERLDFVTSLHQPLDRLDRESIARAFAPLVTAGQRLVPDGAEKYADCRFAGQGYEVTVGVSDDEPAFIERAFRQAHEERYGHADPYQSIEVVNLRLVVARHSMIPVRFSDPGDVAPKPGRRTIVTRHGDRVDAAVWPLGQLPADLTIDGPAVLAGPDATGFIEPGWRGAVQASGAVAVQRL